MLGAKIVGAIIAALAAGHWYFKEDPAVLCHRLADAVARMSVKCGSDQGYTKEYQDFINKVAYGDCKTITQVRDAKALTQICLTWFEDAHCDLVMAGQIPPVCLNPFGS